MLVFDACYSIQLLGARCAEMDCTTLSDYSQSLHCPQLYDHYIDFILFIYLFKTLFACVQ